MPEALSIYARFLRIGLRAFGGPFPQIATLQQEFVVHEKWTTNARFNRTLAVYQALPGPEATEMCVWLGSVRAGRLGGLAAGLGFLTPGTLLVLLAAFLYTRFGLPPAAAAAMSGAQCAALALLFAAVYTLARHACADSTLWFIAAAAAATSLSGMHFSIILVLSTLGGYLTDRGKNWLGFGLIGAMAFFSFMFFLWKLLSSPEDAPPPLTGPATPADHAALLDATLTGLKAGLLSFGGAYTAVPFLRDDAVVMNHWMTHTQFLDGIAIVNALPTPLVSLAGFVGFVAGGWPAALLMLAAVYLPAFAVTLIGHQRIERLIDNEPLHAALDGAAAGVVGLVAAAAVLMVKPTLIDGPIPPGAFTPSVSIHWPIKAAIGAAALLIALRYRPRWLNPALVLIAAAIGAVLLR
ncbi:MAG: chromate efflux transporter [Phycisphaerales bacterium]|nr:chromate efflux transporter [Phycisphaerales bacterium]